MTGPGRAHDEGRKPLTTQTSTGDTTEPYQAGPHAVPFSDFGISEAICSGLAAAGIHTTFPIQTLALPLALRGQDIIGQARTGTGKTLAFGIPLLQLIEDGPKGAPRGLVVVPTRELAIQVGDDLRTAAVNLRARVATVYGGRAYEPQIDALTAGVDIVVGTPGRLLDLAQRRHLDLSAVQALVLDEADKMLDLGFLPDVERIVRLTPADRQTMLFSATMPAEVVTLARRHMRRPTHVRAEGHDEPAPAPLTQQHVFRTHQMDKIEVLARVLQARDRGLTMVFCQTKRTADQVAKALTSVDIVVGTPGRLLDLVRQRHLNLSHVHALVLDEADKMLDLGFLPDVEKILSLTPADRQTMLFSATMPGEVVTLARRHLRRPMHIRAEQHDEQAYVPSTQQFIYRAHQMDKIEVLARVLQAEGRGLSIVFCRTKRSADQVAGALTTRGFAAAAVHGDLGQGQRERAMRAFRAGKVDVLVATDVAARGLDVDDVTHVINYECPEDEKAYLHRIGRTGRAGRAGVAVTFVDWNDLSRWKLTDDVLGLGTPEPAETYSTSDHLYSDLSIPEGATGTLPRAQRARAGLEAEQLEDIGETGRTRSRTSHPTSRGHSRRGGSGRSDRGPAGGDEDREPAQRRQRVRRRLRSGVQVTDGQEQAGGHEPSAGEAKAAAADPAGAPATAAASRPRRRRRRSSHKPAVGTAAQADSTAKDATPTASPADSA